MSKFSDALRRVNKYRAKQFHDNYFIGTQMFPRHFFPNEDLVEFNFTCDETIKIHVPVVFLIISAE